MGSGPKLSKQEQNLYNHHLYNLRHLDGGGGFTQPTGEVSTVLQRVVGPIKGKYYSIPSVWDGRALNEMESAGQAFGLFGTDYWPSYPTPEAADDRYLNYLHPIMDRDMRRRERNK